MKTFSKIDEAKTAANVESREEYMEEIKKKLPKINSLEAMKAIYETTLICMSNEQKMAQSKVGS